MNKEFLDFLYAQKQEVQALKKKAHNCWDRAFVTESPDAENLSEIYNVYKAQEMMIDKIIMQYMQLY